MKFSKTTLFLIVLVAALIAIKFLFLSPAVKAPMQGPAGPPQAVNCTGFVVKPSRFDNNIQSSGTISASEEVDLKAEASGKITQINFKEGENVSKGALLVKLNDSDLLAQRKKIEMEVKLASDKESRQKKLLEIKAISQEEYDAAQNQLDGLKADLEFNMAQILKTEIRAPFAGVIGLKSVSEGSYVSPTIKIASMQQLNPVKIDFSVPEKYASLVKRGGEISFTVQGSAEVFKGSIYAIEPKIDLATRTLLIRATCKNTDGKLLPGSFARVEMMLHRSENSIFIPTEAIIPELKGQKVFLCKDGKSSAQKVETGIRTDAQIEITSGLNAGDTVITTGIMQMKPGTPVKFTEVK